MKLKYKTLKYGEFYKTTKELVYSNFDDNYSQITVPAGEKILFRSFQPYGRHKDKELALFFWLKMKTSICLVVSDETPILYLDHLDWDRRDEIVEVEDVKA